MSTKIEQSAAKFLKHCKLNPAVAAALLLAGSVFGSPAQAAIVQLDLLGQNFSGYIFIDTSTLQTHPTDARFSYYYGTSYISTPASTGGSLAYTTNPINPYTGSPVKNDASFPYLMGNVYIESLCEGVFCNYYIEPTNYDGSISILNVSGGPQSSIAHMIDGTFVETPASFDLYSNFSNPPIVSGAGSIKLPAVIAPPASPVPEPATWALMIGGFGMIGGAARYKRRRTTMTYA